MLPLRTASSSASGMEAALVLPYSARLLITLSCTPFTTICMQSELVELCSILDTRGKLQHLHQVHAMLLHHDRTLL